VANNGDECKPNERKRKGEKGEEEEQERGSASVVIPSVELVYSV
jgi:hypothetical protein